jgi:hypothetical protein
VGCAGGTVPKILFYDGDAPRDRIYIQTPVRQRRRYGIFRFCVDICMTALTGGLWLIWIFVREMRAR